MYLYRGVDNFCHIFIMTPAMYIPVPRDGFCLNSPCMVTTGSATLLYLDNLTLVVDFDMT